MANQVVVGPWGGEGGVNPWTFLPDGRIDGFRISSGLVVDSIMFTYKDKRQGSGSHYSPRYGGDGGTLNPPVKFDDDEDLTRVSGTFGKFMNYGVVVTSLSFHTKKDTYGPYGKVDGTSFGLPVIKGKFIGFFGNYGSYIDSLGFILKP